jgi:hypothetical protein
LFAPFESLVGITSLEYQNIDSLLQCAKQVERIELGGPIAIVGSRGGQYVMEDREKQRHINLAEAAYERRGNCASAEFKVRRSQLPRRILVAFNENIVGVNANVAGHYVRPLETKITTAAAEVQDALSGKIDMLLYETASFLHSSRRSGSPEFSLRVSLFPAAGLRVIPKTLVQIHRHNITP